MQARVTRRTFLKGIGLLGASAALAACGQANSSAQGSGASSATPLLAIIHTNDTHGHDIETEATDKDPGSFSMAAVASLKAEWEAKGYEVLLVDAGDATQGMPLVDTSEGSSAIAFMNACGYQLMTVGNHEFDWAAENLDHMEKQANFPFLSANVMRKDNGERRFAANKVFELASGAKVGFFGLTTPATSTSASPKDVEAFRFLQDEELVSCAQSQVDELRGKGCDLVVCVGHIGNKTNGELNSSRALLQHVKGIDLFIDGHDHQEVEEEVAGTLLVETGCYLHNIGVVVIDEGVPQNEPVAYGSFDKVDKSVQAVIDQENERVQSQLNVVLGTTPFLLDGNRAPGVRTQETNLGDFIADAYKWTAEQELHTKIDASILNGGGIRQSIEAGDISLGSIKAVMPFSNELTVINVTGAQLLETLEASCQAVGTDSAIGGFAQVSGITYTIDASIPYEKGPNYPETTIPSPAKPGSRVTITDVGGKGFLKDAAYAVATNSFVSEGGDTYHAFKEAADAQSPVMFSFDYEAISSYLVTACDHMVPNAYAEPQGRITILGA